MADLLVPNILCTVPAKQMLKYLLERTDGKRKKAETECISDGKMLFKWTTLPPQAVRCPSVHLKHC